MAAPSHRRTAHRPEHRVVALVYDGIQGLDLTGPVEVLHGANQVLDHEGRTGARYRTTVASLTGGTIETESGLRLETAAIDDAAIAGAPVDTLLVPGGLGVLTASDDLVDAVGEIGRRSRRVVSICTGAFLAAAAGLLDGRRVTTHWARAAELARRHPDLEIDSDPIYLRDGDVWTSAGVTAGIDLALALVEHDHDAEVAQVVARWLVMFLRRPGGQTQFATSVWSERADSAPIRAAQDLIDADPAADHRVGLLADRVGLSARHFARRFSAEVGQSPAQYVISVRLDAARAALETSDATVDVIAARTGFTTSETMRRTFAHRLGVSPDQYRRRFRRHPGPDHPNPTPSGSTGTTSPRSTR